MFRKNDLEKINLVINDIKDNASYEFKKNNEPTFEESRNIINHIIKFIKKKKKKVYGGFAQNLLISNKDPSKSFYKVIDGVYYCWPDIADIEFYSYDPLNDIYELTNELFNLNFTHIQAKEGVHEGTFKIFVNFINYCDISYMPTYIYNKVPYLEIDKIKCAHPHFMLIDGYRMLADPLTSYWRLDKMVDRLNLLLTYYPMNNNYNKINFEEKLLDNNLIIKYINKKIIYKSKLIVVGLYAYNYYIKKVSHKDKINLEYLELITDELKKDGKLIFKKLSNKFKNITVKEFFPFYEYFDRRIEYYYNNKLILKLYNNNKKCIVYNFSIKKQTYFGTFSLIYLYFLINYFYALVNNDSKNKNNIIKLLGNLIFFKNKYLNKKNITVVDKSPFQYFTFNCLGKPIHPIRESLLKIRKKKKFIYSPSKKKTKKKKKKFNNIY